jgi:porphobilinogen synthase
MSVIVTGQFPAYRPRRLRQSPALRQLIAETHLSARQLILPLFAVPGEKVRKAVGSMPGVFQLSIDELVREAAEAQRAGVPAVLLFGIPEQKDAGASGAYADNGIVQSAVRELKKQLPGMLVITDVCLCEYTEHGHCGLLHEGDKSGRVHNDPTLALLAKTAASHAAAGADIVAPSDMMDGRVRAIREQFARFANSSIRMGSPKPRSCHTQPSSHRAFTDRSGRLRNRHQLLGIDALTRWMPPTGTKPCVRWPWISPKALTW